MTEICPYCGKLMLESYCTFCNQDTKETEAHKLYRSLTRDIEELTFNQDYRELWYDRAEKLKTMNKELYNKAMEKARQYNEEYRENERRLAFLEEIEKYLERRYGKDTIKKMHFFEYYKISDNATKELLKQKKFEKMTWLVEDT